MRARHYVSFIDGKWRVRDGIIDLGFETRRGALRFAVSMCRGES